MNEVKLGSKSKICGDIDNERLFVAAMHVASELSGDNISQVLTTCYEFIQRITREIFPKITLNVMTDFNKHVDQICLHLINKCGEANVLVKQQAIETALVMGRHPKIGPNPIVTQIIKGKLKKRAHNSVKHLTAKIDLLNRFLANYSMQQYGIEDG